MNDQDFTTTFMVDQTPEEAFAAINNVCGWWSEALEGSSSSVGDEFIYRHGDLHYSKQEVTDFIPAQKVVWRVLESRLSVSEHKDEWKDTTITFDIAKKGDKTEVRFTQAGLVPELECFENCSSGWRYFFTGSLQSLITTGKGTPDTKEDAEAKTPS